ncbi:MAG: SDR family NAD(P)-dependent oxidoreductase [Candidatus Thiodiazotropha lotti]|uniref:Oxidoreductase n=2 Tax=Candidatus Thiodiazotropha TaxID=1913444 RepID=A0A1E2URI2_9GAMM|nr:SDR family NAD(P)-dependent oxidoreductase [Candidatus Thiodiazotropha endoloripes]MCG7871253.1 SDR family NAD(P)-dependent oxidoreductase [Candidatus Thiodiazotropha lotti]MCG7897681.1 SDR family NAD(P)-dependent oxidoreductase [Candidatus Thiodiazotropha weberae]MCG7902119.1 SDR family NAD(P)-dependent oxidoreductase [Candidatus Thiodiazotropha weberae]MCG7914010.1 SDR family NAD(P)-dependent oxidoreductase [Candidatus Thiodiazotropha weberae]MCG7932784.1 SDR family NAD(P)-dependent oxido
MVHPLNDEQSTAPVAWITGGGSGIGRSLAHALSDMDWTVVISGRNREKLIKTLESGGKQPIRQIALDVTDAQSVSGAIGEIEREYGRIDYAFLNAGDYSPMRLNDFDPLLFHRLNDVNYLGVVNCLAALLPGMKERAQGQILITASLSGYCGLPGAAPYSATKAALINLAESLQPELSQLGIRIRLINPGFVATDLTHKNDFKMPFLITPAMAANEIKDQLMSNRFEIRFPATFSWIMKALSWMPYRVYFALMRRLLK